MTAQYLKDSFARIWWDIGRAAWMHSRGWEWIGCGWKSTDRVFALKHNYGRA